MGTQRAPTVDASAPPWCNWWGFQMPPDLICPPWLTWPRKQRSPSPLWRNLWWNHEFVQGGKHKQKTSSRGAAKTQIQMCFCVLSHSKVHGVINYDVFFLCWSTMGCLAEWASFIPSFMTFSSDSSLLSRPDIYGSTLAGLRQLNKKPGGRVHSWWKGVSDFSFKCVEHKEGGCHAAEGDDIDAKLMLKMESVELPELLLPPPPAC